MFADVISSVRANNETNITKSTIYSIVTSMRNDKDENIAKLLSVDFVKNGQYTVVPFPFKYINEVLEKL